jgi:hypothetical protein
MRPEKKPKQGPYRPHHPAEYDVADVSAIQALKRGDATPDQQRRALKWIIENNSRTYDLPYFDDDEGGRASAFAAGKAYVGQQIVKLSKLDVAELRKRQENQKP